MAERTTPLPALAPTQIFVTSFNKFKKALTFDKICDKVRPYRDQVLVLVDEVDDFLDRDKLIFNICSNKGNDFQKPTLERYFEVSRAAYRGDPCPDAAVGTAENPEYWAQLHEKFGAIQLEVQEKSRSINKSFGIFNAQTLRHSSRSIAHDIEGYKSLIARPYASVNRAMPGSYYRHVQFTRAPALVPQAHTPMSAHAARRTCRTCRRAQLTAPRVPPASPLPRPCGLGWTATWSAPST